MFATKHPIAENARSCMLKTVKIKNFRGFRQFELHDLGRINLLVGANNSGKTSALEAIQLLCARDNLKPLADMIDRRGEYLWNERTSEKELDIRHLFHNHKIGIEDKDKIEVLGESRGIDKSEKLTIISDLRMKRRREASDNRLEIDPRGTDDDLDDFKSLQMILDWSSGQEQTGGCALNLSDQGGLSINSINSISIRARMGAFNILGSMETTEKSEFTTQFVTSSGLTVPKVIELFERVVLTPEEETVYQALRAVEPKIERIASVGSVSYNPLEESRQGFVVRANNSRMPIGSMGDGVWRMLGLTLAAVEASNGFLFVDEIDTGLHFSAMNKMWELIWEVSKRLDVQIFATTHSSDCWESLADVASRYDTTDDGITIQRIERNQPMGRANAYVSLQFG
ncbi:AAA family ATPase [Leptothoe sp. PORK10 BA2]|uniref:AAA family ATPase n=1 Tax=Leptothoe sp. PORK10 BA2 TaxID=3110254 RepID=UPI002B214346|nr:AAA family ATPase [Leptothoe sp. PORK10 BA2]MEA5464272.1 AAA family ATPase [Leptothoe sp. PORK10 BA2]